MLRMTDEDDRFFVVAGKFEKASAARQLPFFEMLAGYFKTYVIGGS